MRPVKYAIKCRILDSINSIVTSTIRFPNKFRVMSEFKAAKRDAENCEFEYPVLKLSVYLRR